MGGSLCAMMDSTMRCMVMRSGEAYQVGQHVQGHDVSTLEGLQQK
jgi:acyl-coenzyme A thioesterase PaaI-like protein